MIKFLNTTILRLRLRSQAAVAATLMMAWAGAACGTDTYSAGQLSIPTLAIGGATYSNVVVRVGSIVSGPVGTSPYGDADTYNPANGQLTVQSVTVGSATHYNLVVTVASLVSIGGVAGADTYDGSDLTIPLLQVLGGPLYTNVVVDGGTITSVAGGMPGLAFDTYDAQADQLAVPALVNRVDGRIYTNAIVGAGILDSNGPPGYLLRANGLNPEPVTAGNTATSTVTVTPANGYSGIVRLSCALASGGIPHPGCAVSPAAVAISGISAQNATLTVSTSADAPGGTYTFTVSASDSNQLASANGPQTLKLTTLPLIQHVVIIFQENRTPDNLFHDPVLIARGADIASSGKNSLGQSIALRPINLGTIGPIPQNYDLYHAHSAFVAMYDGGKMDGANLIPCYPARLCPSRGNPFPQYRYVIASDVAPYFALAEQYTFGDRMFQTNQGPSFPAHQFIFGATSAPTATSPLFAAENLVYKSTLSGGCIAAAGTTVQMIDASGRETRQALQYPCFEHPTLSDLLDARGLSWRYYTYSAGSIWSAPDAIEHICQEQIVSSVLTCEGPLWLNNVSIPQTNVLTDIASGQLADVSWVIPDSLSSDHAQGTDGSGPSWVASIVNAIGNSAYWANTAIIITWDDWGGWYDHVAPKVVNDGVSWGSGYTYGFRVPLIVVSPYARAAYISHVTHDFGSILKFIERNFNLPSLGYADAAADDLADCFDFSQAPLAFRQIPAARPAAYFLNSKRPSAPPDDD
jgi:phospholipase C